MAALEKSTKLSQETKENWLSVVTNDFMSSEESDGEEIIIHPLPWQSARVDEVMSKIDDFIEKHRLDDKINEVSQGWSCL